MSESIYDVNLEDYLLGYFAGSTINNLTIKYVENYESIDNGIFLFLNSNNITIDEGITTIGVGDFEGREKGNLYGKQVTIPTSITNIGSGAFNNWPSTSIINVKRSQSDFEANVTVDSDWYGNATVVYNP